MGRGPWGLRAISSATLLLGVWRGIAENNRLPSPKLGAVTGALGGLGTPYECGMAGAA